MTRSPVFLGVFFTFSLASLGCGSSGNKPPAADPEAETPPAPPAPRDAKSDGGLIGCDEAIDQNLEKMKGNPASDADKKAVKTALNAGRYLNSCEVEASAFVEICATITDGAVIGLGVEINPGLPAQAECVADAVKKLEFPTSTAVIRASTQFEPKLN
ncbi:MAG: hypothetical protein AAGA56_26380 [Myxococcota bacterium]